MLVVVWPVITVVVAAFLVVVWPVITVVVGALLVVVWPVINLPDHDQQRYYHHAPRQNQRLLMQL